MKYLHSGPAARIRLFHAVPPLYATLLSVWLAGCGGSGAVATNPFRIDAEAVAATVQGKSVLVNGTVRFGCTFNIQATGVNGSTADVATWQSADLAYSRTGIPNDRTTDAISAADLTTLFGSAQVAQGSTHSGAVATNDDGPYSVVITFHFLRGDGSTGSASLQLTCQQ